MPGPMGEVELCIWKMVLIRTPKFAVPTCSCGVLLAAPGRRWCFHRGILHSAQVEPQSAACSQVFRPGPPLPLLKPPSGLVVMLPHPNSPLDKTGGNPGACSDFLVLSHRSFISQAVPPQRTMTSAVRRANRPNLTTGIENGNDRAILSTASQG